MELKLSKGTIHYDKSDEKLVSQYHWYIGAKGYVYGYKKPRGKELKQFRMHRILLGLKPRKGIVDHINGNRLDNRRCNLRVGDAQLNAINKRNTPSKKYRGVYWDNSRNAYQISVRHKGKNYSGGRYKDINEAAIAVERLRKRVFGSDYPDNPYLALNY